LIKGNLQAHCIGTKTHYEVPDSVMESVKQLKKEELNEDEIVHKIVGTDKLSERLFIIFRWLAHPNIF